MPNEYITIALTGRPPVRIKDENWPLVAVAKDSDGDHYNRNGAKWAIRVRQHDDGRAIVYGSFSRISPWVSKCREDSGGELVPASSDHRKIIEAIRSVGEDLESRMPDDATGRFPRLIHKCIADLPEEELE